MELDALIFGGGAAGLWLLDELHRCGRSVLLVENGSLGAGQTVTCQGIIHGGIKYTLSGALTPSARAIRDMPAIWRDCLAGRREPDLSRTRLASPCCYLWRTVSLASKLGLVGARLKLRTGTTKVASKDRPAALAACPGDVFRVDEQVIDVVSFLHDLADRHADRLVKVAGPDDVTFETSGPGQVDAVRIQPGCGADALELRPARVVFTAGAGNAGLRARVGLSQSAMQRRPLHMVQVRGDLPTLFGHCVDGARTRVTITTAVDSAGRTVWQVGGQVSEDGVTMDETGLIQFAKRELTAVLPGVELGHVEWSTYRVDRAEATTEGGSRPDGPGMRREGSVITAWPTKLALVPELARMITDRLIRLPKRDAPPRTVPQGWPRPEAARPPWETTEPWHS